MKISFITKLTGLCLMAIPLFYGCHEKEGNDNPILIYIKGNDQNITKGEIIRTSSGKSVVTLDAAFICSATREVPSDETVRLAVDNALVAEYNAKHDTKYLPVPEDSYEFSHNATAVIKSGTFNSTDTVVLTLTRPESLDADSIYIIPVRLLPTTHQPSNNFGVVYVIINTRLADFRGVTKAPKGTLINPGGQGWSLTSNDGVDPEVILISDHDYWWIARTPATAIINFNSIKTLKGIKLNSYGGSYAPSEISLAWSNDGITWNDLGVAALLSPTSDAGLYAQYVEFYEPITTSFVKLSITKGSSLAITLFSIFVE